MWMNSISQADHLVAHRDVGPDIEPQQLMDTAIEDVSYYIVVTTNMLQVYAYVYNKLFPFALSRPSGTVHSNRIG